MHNNSSTSNNGNIDGNQNIDHKVVVKIAPWRAWKPLLIMLLNVWRIVVVPCAVIFLIIALGPFIWTLLTVDFNEINLQSIPIQDIFSYTNIKTVFEKNWTYFFGAVITAIVAYRKRSMQILVYFGAIATIKIGCWIRDVHFSFKDFLKNPAQAVWERLNLKAVKEDALKTLENAKSQVVDACETTYQNVSASVSRVNNTLLEGVVASSSATSEPLTKSTQVIVEIKNAATSPEVIANNPNYLKYALVLGILCVVGGFAFQWLSGGTISASTQVDVFKAAAAVNRSSIVQGAVQRQLNKNFGEAISKITSELSRSNDFSKLISTQVIEHDKVIGSLIATLKKTSLDLKNVESLIGILWDYVIKLGSNADNTTEAIEAKKYYTAELLKILMGSNSDPRYQNIEQIKDLVKRINKIGNTGAFSGEGYASGVADDTVAPELNEVTRSAWRDRIERLSTGGNPTNEFASLLFRAATEVLSTGADPTTIVEILEGVEIPVQGDSSYAHLDEQERPDAKEKQKD